MRIPTTLLLALLASTAGAQSLELPFAGVPVAQNTGAPDRGAAGNGSMGIGSGVEHLDEAERTDQGGSRQSSGEQLDDSAEPGHGGNETDMEHRRRPKLERRSD